MEVFAKPGESQQQVGGNCPAGWITMVSQRPGNYSCANIDGTWGVSIEPPKVYSCTKSQGEFALLELDSPEEGQPTFLHWVESLIAVEADPIAQRKMQASFNASTWRSDDPFVLKVWTLANKPESELETLFIHAATL